MMNGGIDQLADEITTYGSTINQTLKTEKEVAIEGWARSVVGEDSIGDFFLSFLTGGVTEFLDGLTGAFTYVRGIMTRELNQFYTKISGINSYRSNNLSRLLLKGTYDMDRFGTGGILFWKGDFGDKNSGLYFNRFGGVALDLLMQTDKDDGTAEDPVYATKTYKRYDRKKDEEVVGRQVVDDEIAKLITQQVSKDFISDYLDEKGLNSYVNTIESSDNQGNYYEMILEQQQNADSETPYTKILENYTGEIPDILEKSLETEDYSQANREFDENDLSSITDKTINESFALNYDALDDMGSSRLIYTDGGLNPTDTSNVDVTDQFNDDTSGSDVMAALATVLGLNAITSAMGEAFSGSESGETDTGILGENVYLQYNSEMNAEFRYRMYAFQSILNMSMTVAHLIQEARLQVAESFSSELGIKATSSSDTIRSIVFQALDGELSQLNKANSMFSQAVQSLTQDVNSLNEARIKSCESVLDMGLKIAKTVGHSVILTVIGWPIITTALAGIATSLLSPATAYTGYSAIISGAGMPTWWLSGLGAIGYSIMDLTYQTIMNVYKVANDRYQSPVTMFQGYKEDVTRSNKLGFSGGVSTGDDSLYYKENIEASAGYSSYTYNASEHSSLEKRQFFDETYNDLTGKWENPNNSVNYRSLKDYTKDAEFETDDEDSNIYLGTHHLRARSRFSNMVDAFKWSNAGSFVAEGTGTVLIENEKKGTSGVPGFSNDASFLSNRGMECGLKMG